MARIQGWLLSLVAAAAAVLRMHANGSNGDRPQVASRPPPHHREVLELEAARPVVEPPQREIRPVMPMPPGRGMSIPNYDWFDYERRRVALNNDFIMLNRSAALLALQSRCKSPA